MFFSFGNLSHAQKPLSTKSREKKKKFAREYFFQIFSNFLKFHEKILNEKIGKLARPRYFKTRPDRPRTRFKILWRVSKFLRSALKIFKRARKNLKLPKLGVLFRRATSGNRLYVYERFLTVPPLILGDLLRPCSRPGAPMVAHGRSWSRAWRSWERKEKLMKNPRKINEKPMKTNKNQWKSMKTNEKFAPAAPCQQFSNLLIKIYFKFWNSLGKRMIEMARRNKTPSFGACVAQNHQYTHNFCMNYFKNIGPCIHP